MPLGPVDVYIVGFPGNKFSGEIVPAILEQVERGVIRVVDLLFVVKDVDGTVAALSIEDLGPEGAAFAEVDVVQAGALNEEDADEVAEDIPAGTARRCSSPTRTPGCRTSCWPSPVPTPSSSTRSAFPPTSSTRSSRA